MDKDAFDLFLAMGAAHMSMTKHSRVISERADVGKVTHWTYMFDAWGEFQWTEYVDAEHPDGRSTSWRVELALTPDRAALEADVRRIPEGGDGDYDVLAVIADRTYPTAGECAAGLRDATRRLCSANP